MPKKTFYVTTPIYYPSASLHLGHVYSTTLAWVLRNYKSANGYDAVMLTGADEHGQKIETIARAKKLLPQKYVDKMSILFARMWKKMAIDFDFYSRTTSKKHKQAVQKQFSSLLKTKAIFLGKYKGLYSIQDEEFLTSLQAKVKDGKYFHPLSGHKLQTIEEASYFFKMSQYQKWLQTYFRDNPQFISPQKIVKELTNNFLSAGLEDLSVSRTSFKWGIPILENPRHIIYVWLDALNNYITTLGYNQNDDANFQKYWANGDEIVHIVGKEITRFHCIYWPIILKANKLRLPTKIFSHGWIITLEGKMSKSKGNVIDPLVLAQNYGAEQLKYYLASHINHGQDGVFELKTFINVINADLANNVGNLVSRTIAMIVKNNLDLRKIKLSNHKADLEVGRSIKKSFKNYQKYFDDFKVAEALQEPIKLSKQLNKYVDLIAPWKIPNQKQRLCQIFNNLLNGIYAIAAMLQVVAPAAMAKVRNQIGVPKLKFSEIANFDKFRNAQITKGNPIFKRQTS